MWSSSGSSPIQQSSRSSHQSPLQLRKSLDPNTNASSPTQSRGGEVLSLQQFLDEGIDPTEVNAGGPHAFSYDLLAVLHVETVYFSFCSLAVRRTLLWTPLASLPRPSMFRRSEPQQRLAAYCAPPVGKPRLPALIVHQGQPDNRVVRAYGRRKARE